MNILIVANYRGWAWDYKARNLKKHLYPRGFNVDIAYMYDMVPDPSRGTYDTGVQLFKSIDYSKYDRVLFFSKLMEPIMNSTLDYKRTYVGVCSHQPYNGRPNYDSDVEYFKKFKGVFVNNLILYDEFSPLIRNLYYCPNGVDIDFFQPTKKAGVSDELVVGWVGERNHKNNKGFDEIIEPLGQLENVRVEFCDSETHRIPHSDMPFFYNSIDVYICASESEGTPNPCLETSACGRPIVTTPVGNMPEFIHHGKNGFLAKRSIESISEYIRYFQNHRQELRKMGVNARATAENWSWSIQATRFVDMLLTN